MKLKSLVSRFLIIGTLGSVLAGCPTNEQVESGKATLSAITSTNKYGTNLPNTIIQGSESVSITDIEIDSAAETIKGQVEFNNLKIVLAPGTSREDTYTIEKLEVRFDSEANKTYDTTIGESCADGSSAKACKEFKSAGIWRNLVLAGVVDNGNGSWTITAQTNGKLPKYGTVPTLYKLTFNYQLNGGVVTPACRADQIVVDNTCACPSGQSEIGGVCQVPVSCRADQLVVNNSCACPSGQTEIGGVCQVPVSCRADQVVVNNTCACPSGQTEISGVCQVPVSCRADQIVVDNNCACPSGLLEIGGSCQAPVQCREDQVAVNNVCACPEGQVEFDGLCQDQALAYDTYTLTSAYFWNEAAGVNTSYIKSGALTYYPYTGKFEGLQTISYNTAPAGFNYKGTWSGNVPGNLVTKTNETCTKKHTVNPCAGFLGNWSQTTHPDAPELVYPVSVEKIGNQIIVKRASYNGYFEGLDVFIFTNDIDLIYCPAGTDQIGAECVERPKCPAGRDYDAVNNQCVLPPPSCREDQVLNPDANACVCPDGESEIDGVCQVPVSCRADQVVVNNSCTCPSGQSEINNICQVPVQCRVDQVATPQNTCACPSGKTEINGVCQIPASCRIDQVVVNNSCVCPSGQSEINGVCQVPVQCRVDQIATPQNTCACPSGQTEINGVCTVPAVNYGFTSGAFSNTFGSGNYTISTPNGPLTKAADGTVSGKVTVQYVSGTAGFNYAGTWSFKPGVNQVIKSGETCTNTGSQNACGTMNGNWTSNTTVVESGSTITVTYKTTSFPAQTNTYVFTKQ